MSDYMEFEIKMGDEVEVKQTKTPKLFNFSNDYIMNQFVKQLGEKDGVNVFRAYMMNNAPEFFNSIKPKRDYEKDIKISLSENKKIKPITRENLLKMANEINGVNIPEKFLIEQIERSYGPIPGNKTEWLKQNVKLKSGDKVIFP